MLEQTILIEAALSRLTDRAEQEQSIVFENGTKDAVKLQQRITADTSKPFLHQLHAVLALPETDDDTPVQREVRIKKEQEPEEKCSTRNTHKKGKIVCQDYISSMSL